MLEYAARIVGPCEEVEDRSWDHQASSVLRLRDAEGGDWFLKRHQDAERYDAEVTAYRRWVPALGENAPRLRAYDDILRTVILSAVPGEPPPWPASASGGHRGAELDVQRRAGVLLRRFHDAQAAVRWDDFGAVKAEEFERFAARAAELLSPREVDFARSEVRALTGLGRPPQVPCHRDYTPRNWLVDDSRLYVIDFELARLDVWVSDLVRLYFGVWTDRPDLQEAFLDGYGRRIGDTDRGLLLGCGVLAAVWLVVKGREYGQAALVEANHRTLQRLMAGRRRCPR